MGDGRGTAIPLPDPAPSYGFYYGQPARSTVNIDMVQYNPTIEFDGEIIVKDGKLTCLGEV